MADFPVELAGGLGARLVRSIDPEGKIPRALDALGPVRNREVVLVDADEGFRARQLTELGARVVAVVRPGERERFEGGAPASGSVASSDGVPDPVVSAERVLEGTPRELGVAAESADIVVACWSAFRGPSETELAEADRVLRPDGRLLVLHDYGRDDVSGLWPDAQADNFAWSRRDGWFLRSGFRIRVIHCWWSFDSADEARAALVDVAGDRGASVAARLKRPRLSYNVAIYHRVRGGDAGAASIAGDAERRHETPAVGEDRAANVR